MKVFAFEGPDEVYAAESLAAAEGFFEATDVQNDEYVFLGDDGTVIQPTVQAGRVVLTPTEEKRPNELRARLRTFLVNPRVAMEPVLADDPQALAALLIAQNRRKRRLP